MKIIRGKITESVNHKSLTCCSNTDDILVGGNSLYDILDEYFDLDIPSESDIEYIEDNIDSNIGISYLILDEDPGSIRDYDSFIGDWVIKKLYSELVTGCYSEMTCGPGSYEFLFGDKGHNLGQEFSSYIGKYVLLRIDDKRDIIIDSILNDN